MGLCNNPFYMLRLSCAAGRREIAEAADEMSFVLEPDIVTDAQNTLTNPARRLGAELDWFIDVSDTTLKSIRRSIEEGNPISTDRLSGISKLNASIFNFTLLENNPFDLGYAILEMDELFSKITVDDVINQLSSDRTKAKITVPSGQNIAAELSKKRDSIRQEISEKLALLDKDSYIELISTLVEKCIVDVDYSDGIVLSDVIDQYELRMYADLESGVEKIEAHIERIKRETGSSISEELGKLVTQVKSWAFFARPLQLKAQSSGVAHILSEKLASELREFSLWLHNEKKKTQEALKLTNGLKDAFSDYEVISSKFKEDVSQLKKLLSEKQDSDRISDELEAIKKVSEQIKSSPGSNYIVTFIEKIRNLNTFLCRLNIESTEKIKLRESLCYMARSTAIELHNNLHRTKDALSITNALIEIFSDVSSVKYKLSEDKEALSRQLQLTSFYSTVATSSKRNSSSNKSGCAIFAIVPIIFIIIALVGASSSCNKSSSTSKSTSSYSSKTTKVKATATVKPKATATVKPKSTVTRFSSSSTVGSSVFVDIVSIFPEIGIYTQGSLNYDHFACRCRTSTGSTVWIYMSTSSYRSNFDPTASTLISNKYANEKSFTSKRVYGTVKRAENIMTGLSTKTGTLVIEFSSTK